MTKKIDKARYQALASPDLARIVFDCRTADDSAMMRSRKGKRGFDLISNALPFGRLWYDGPNAVANAIGYAEHRSRSHDAVIRVTMTPVQSHFTKALYRIRYNRDLKFFPCCPRECQQKNLLAPGQFSRLAIMQPFSEHFRPKEVNKTPMQSKKAKRGKVQKRIRDVAPKKDVRAGYRPPPPPSPPVPIPYPNIP